MVSTGKREGNEGLYLLRQALPSFRGDWEVEPIIETLVNLIPLEYRRDKAAARELLNQLYRLNRGSLVQNGLSLPLIVEHNGQGSKGKIKRYIEKTGSEVSFRVGEGFRYKLIAKYHCLVL